MEYKIFENTIAIRLDPGDEVCESILTVCRENRISLATVSGLGATREAQLGAYKVADRTFYPLNLNRELELAALTGSATLMEGEPYLHLHAVFGDETGACYSGHLKRAVIGGTGEIFLQILSGTIGRRLDPETGLNIFDFDGR